MLVNLIFLILGVGLISELLPKNRLPLLWSLLSSVVVFYCAYRLYLQGPEPNLHLVYPWLKIPNLDINMEIVINSQNTYLVMALLVMTFLSLFQNTFGKDHAKNFLNGLIMLNLVSSLMLVFANNYIQMLVAVGVCDVLVYSVINDVEAKKKYIYNNFLANVGLLSIFAIVMSNGAGIELSHLHEYGKIGHHKDFVAIILLICIFIKTGLFMFHGIYTDLRSLNFSRLNFILYATTPLVGYMILLKSESLLSISPYSYPILWIFSLASVLWGAYGAMVIDNLHQKAVYFAMMFWGLVYSFVAFDRSIAPLDFGTLLLAGFLFAQILVLVNVAASNENMVSQMGGFIKNIKLTFLVGLIVLVVYFSAVLSLQAENIYLCWTYVLLLAIVTAHVGSQIMLGQNHSDERVLAMLKNPSLILWVPLVAITLGLGYYFSSFLLYSLPAMAVWTVIFYYRPLQKLDAFYDKAEIQEADYLSSVYELLIITPIKVVGRVLWLLVDFVFIERTVISSVQNALRFMIYVFKKIHSGKIWGDILFVSLGFGIIYAVWYYGGL